MKEKTSTRPADYAGRCRNPQKRAAAIGLIRKGYTMKRAAEVVGVTRQTISIWLKKASGTQTQSKCIIFEAERQYIYDILNETGTVLYSFDLKNYKAIELTRKDFKIIARNIALLINDFPPIRNYSGYEETAFQMWRFVRLIDSLTRAAINEQENQETYILRYFEQIEELAILILSLIND